MRNYILTVVLFCFISNCLSQNNATTEPEVELEEKCKLDFDVGNGTEECKFNFIFLIKEEKQKHFFPFLKVLN